jgi:hypothetical protein
MSILVRLRAGHHNRRMNLRSKYFDRIRIRKPQASPASEAKAGPLCQHPGCKEAGTHRAPMGRHHEGRYLLFCFDHVREYNKTYNYFSGLDDDSIQRFHKDALTGHRPTWTIGVNRWGREIPAETSDPLLNASGRMRARVNGTRAGTAANRPRKPRTLERRALEDLGLPLSAGADQIKSRYKELVKRHHPDANGGDRSTEDRLRQIIQAYKILKQAGYC